MTQQELETKRDALVAAMASGTYRVESGSDAVTFQTIEQMERALAIVDKELALIEGATTSRVTLVSHSRG